MARVREEMHAKSMAREAEIATLRQDKEKMDSALGQLLESLDDEPEGNGIQDIQGMRHSLEADTLTHRV